eukprot:SAG31_NODE_9574_length_1256_cov_18.992221_2_plen_92_part_01
MNKFKFIVLVPDTVGCTRPGILKYEDISIVVYTKFSTKLWRARALNLGTVWRQPGRKIRLMYRYRIFKIPGRSSPGARSRRRILVQMSLLQM